MLRWQLDAARTWRRETGTDGRGLRVVTYVDERHAAQRRLYEDLGLQPLRWYADMTLLFDGPPPALDQF